MGSTKKQKRARAPRSRLEKVVGTPVRVIRTAMQAPAKAWPRLEPYLKVTGAVCSVMAGRGQHDCPIQFTWYKGQMALRFCRAQGEKGRIIPIEDGIDAMAKAQEVCRAWREKGAAAFDAKPVSRYQLGRLNKR